jgi:hypothetical protein
MLSPSGMTGHAGASLVSRRRAGPTGGTLGAGATTVLRIVPSRSTDISTTSPTRSGGGVSMPVRPHNSASAPDAQVPDASTSPFGNRIKREKVSACCGMKYAVDV